MSKGKISIFSTIHRLAIEPTKFSNVESIGKYDDAGNCSNGFYDCDIISEWQEEINERGLDKLAEHWCPESGLYREGDIETQRVIRNAYKAGYRKALEK